jgi:glycosyltransferase involved in cell wall biosynthesis
MDGDKFVVINNGTLLDNYTNISRTEDTQSVLIMVSRFGEAKDQATVIRSLQYLDNTVKCIFIGDGPLKNNCVELAKELNLLDRISFAGFQSNIPDWISKATIGIQSSKWEGFGLTAIEIMASGIPVIASDVEGLKQVVEGFGLLFKVGDESDLASKIKKLFSDSSFYESVACRCKRRALDFDIHVMADQYNSVYKQLL